MCLGIQWNRFNAWLRSLIPGLGNELLMAVNDALDILGDNWTDLTYVYFSELQGTSNKKINIPGEPWIHITKVT